MRNPLLLATLLAAPLALGACGPKPTPTPTPEAPVNAVSPLLAPWNGPHGGLPPLDQVTVDDFAPAIQAAMDAQWAEIEAITSNPEPATFENTIAAMEDTGRQLGRVLTVFGIFNSTMSTPALRTVEADLAPKLSAFSDRVVQDEALFARIDAVATGPARADLTPEQDRVLERIHLRFRRQGAALAPDAKARLAAINADLASRYTAFSQNLLHDEETWIHLTDEADLAGLAPSTAAAMAAAATERDLEGWIVVNTRSSVDPFLTESTRRDLREQVWRAFVSRGDHAGEHDNKPLITEILALRAERAQLLGHPTYAHWRLEDTMAGSPDAALGLMRSVWGPAVKRVEEEVAAQQAIADAEGADLTIAPWDYRFYMEKVRQAEYDLDTDAIRPYLQLEKLREGMFWVAGELYGLSFSPVTGVPVHHPDVRVWEVTRDGEHVGLWYFDPYARTGKRSGAWMNAYRGQERFRGEVTPIVSNNSNFVKGAPGEPVLISWDDAETLFHEFGHAVHGLLSDVTYPTLAGTNVARDYVEFPSQLHEHWLGTREVLERFATHVETGEPIPQALVDKIHAASTFNQGFGTVEYLASAYVDMELHLAGDAEIDPAVFERETLAELGMPDEIVMRHRTPQFAHVFSGGGYAAGYYSYLWADALTADAAEAFHEAGSMYDEDVAARLVEHVLSAGNTVDAAEAFRAFRGRDVDVGALMRDRGFAAD